MYHTTQLIICITGFLICITGLIKNLLSFRSLKPSTICHFFYPMSKDKKFDFTCAKFTPTSKDLDFSSSVKSKSNPFKMDNSTTVSPHVGVSGSLNYGVYGGPHVGIQATNPTSFGSVGVGLNHTVPSKSTTVGIGVIVKM